MSREENLKTSFNQFLCNKLHLEEKDYYNQLSTEDFLDLKFLLSDINNIVTLKLTLKFIDFIAELFSLSNETKEQIITNIQSINPNSNGFDVEISNPVKIIAEVKGNIPINNGIVFGSAQKNGILKDFESLRFGKSKSSINTQDYYKFFVLPDIEKTRKATYTLLQSLQNNYSY